MYPKNQILLFVSIFKQLFLISRTTLCVFCFSPAFTEYGDLSRKKLCIFVLIGEGLDFSFCLSIKETWKVEIYGKILLVYWYCWEEWKTAYTFLSCSSTSSSQNPVSLSVSPGKVSVWNSQIIITIAHIYWMFLCSRYLLKSFHDTISFHLPANALEYFMCKMNITFYFKS